MFSQSFYYNFCQELWWVTDRISFLINPGIFFITLRYDSRIFPISRYGNDTRIISEGYWENSGISMPTMCLQNTWHYSPFQNRELKQEFYAQATALQQPLKFHNRERRYLFSFAEMGWNCSEIVVSVRIFVLTLNRASALTVSDKR